MKKKDLSQVYYIDSMLREAEYTISAEKLAGAMRSGEIYSVEDLKEKAVIGRSILQILRENGALGNMPETNQLTFF